MSKMSVITMSLLTFIGLNAHAAQPDKTERLITVQGVGKISAAPDVARLWIQVGEEGPRVETVSQQVRRKMDEVMKVLKAQGIAEKDIQTQNYQVSPKMEWKNGRSNRVGFTVSNQVAVKIRDLKKTGAVLSAVMDAGANNINGPQFEFDNPRELERKALESALQDARAKAELLARAAGASLGEVVTIQESGMIQPPPRPMMFRASAVAMDKAIQEEPIAAGEETVQANVSAAFALK
jgi:uncharacterized protein